MSLTPHRCGSARERCWWSRSSNRVTVSATRDGSRRGNAEQSSIPGTVEAFRAALDRAGLAITEGKADEPPGYARWLLGRDGDRSVLVEVLAYDRVRVVAEDGCVVLETRS